jgi:hypothetical protein
MLTDTPMPEQAAPLAILSPLALFERECTQRQVPFDVAQRALLQQFFFAGMAAAAGQAATPPRRPPAHLVDDGFDTAAALHRLRGNLDRHYGPRPAPDPQS